MSEQERCPVCGGRLEPGESSITFDDEDRTLTLRHIPARVCEDCGEAVVSEDTAREVLTTAGQKAESVGQLRPTR